MEHEAEAMIRANWADSEAAGMSDLELLVYQSRLLGAEPSLVLWGGGNTSLKVEERDFMGRGVKVLRVKGSGSDLKAVTERDFPGVRLDEVLPLIEREDMSDEEMVAYLAHTLMEPSSPRPSIETLLHAFVPARSVVHSHADAILALTNNERADNILNEVFGEELATIPYRRPGFFLARQVGLAARHNPEIKGVVLLNHGLITWHDDPREAYRLHIEMVNRAAGFATMDDRRRTTAHPARGEGRPPSVVHRPPSVVRPATIAPILRGIVGRERRVIVSFDDSEEARRFVSGETIPLDRLAEVLRQGAATPDHLQNTMRSPMWVELPDADNPEAIRQSLSEGYERWAIQYKAYYAAYNRGEQMLPAVPRVVLVRGLGMFTLGKDRRAAAISADIYHHTIRIVEAAERIGSYKSLSDEDAFAAEYWPLELYKLTLLPPEKELSRTVALVTGAAGAIGAAIARKLAAEGAHVVCADLDLEKAGVLASELTKSNAGTTALAVRMDVTDEASVRDAYERMLLEYGGVDLLVSNAGVAKAAPLDELTIDDWERSFAVNATGHFLVAREALRIMKMQGTGGSMVFVATKNVTAPGSGFGAYSASKAAEAQLARVLALEGGPFGIRANIVNPDAVFAGSGLWSQEVREQRALAQGIDPSDLEEHYRKRNLLQAQVTAEDVAEAVCFLASRRSAKTTGAMLPVDGGLREAFPR